MTYKKKYKYIFNRFFLYFLLFIITIFNLLCNFDLKDNQQQNFEMLTKENGLSNLSVSSIVQDKYGFMWFGTQGGLNKYNGREVTIYRNDPFSKNVLVHNLVQTMFYDKEAHELWLGTYQGISRFDIAKKSFKNYTVQENAISNSVIVAITKDNQGMFWAGTLNGLNKIDPDTDNITKYSVPGDVVRDLLIDSTGRLLIGTYQGLCYFDPKEQVVKKIELDLPSPYVMIIKEFEKGKLTLGMWNGGVIEIDLASHKILNRYIPDKNVYSLTKTKENNLWIGTWGQGLYAITPEGNEISFSPENSKNTFINSVIYSLYQDETGILWIGTNGSGIVKFSPRKHNYITFSSSSKTKKIKPGKINVLFRDNKDNLWIEVYDSGVQRYNPKTNTLESFIHQKDKPSILNDKVNDIIQLTNGNILLATGKGISEYNYVNNQFRDLDILPDNIIVCPLLEDTENSILWIGSYMNGVFSYNQKTKEVKEYKHSEEIKDSISDNLIYDLLIDNKKRLWIATNNGLNLFLPDTETFKRYKRKGFDKKQLGSNVMRTLFEDSHNNLWIGTNGGGISLYNEEEDNFKTYTEINGLANNTVSGIIEGNDGKLWISTLNGISIFNPDTEDFINLSPDDGIGGWEFNGGLFKEKNGSLLFGASHGVVSIPADFSYERSTEPELYISDIKVFHNSINSSKEFFNNKNLIFSPKENYLEFDFVALDYDNPEKLRFSYKLIGFNDEWVNNGKRDYVAFSNLAPGEYTLLVSAKTAKDVTSSIEKVHFIIKKPWSKTTFAYIFYALALGILIVLILQARERQLVQQKNSELAGLNNELEKKNNLLEKISIKDALTDLYNRRYFDTKLEELLNLSKRGDSVLSLLMLDLDNFKIINDTFGHLAGDNYLIDVSNIIKNNLSRNTDFATRYGGDEFAIILYDTDEKGALAIASKIKEAVANLSSIKGEIDISKLHTTVSIGISTVSPSANTTNEDIIDIADKSLYKSKQNGKNRIFINEIKV